MCVTVYCDLVIQPRFNFSDEIKVISNLEPFFGSPVTASKLRLEPDPCCATPASTPPTTAPPRCATPRSVSGATTASSTRGSYRTGLPA